MNVSTAIGVVSFRVSVSVELAYLLITRISRKGGRSEKFGIESKVLLVHLGSCHASACSLSSARKATDAFYRASIENLLDMYSVVFRTVSKSKGWEVEIQRTIELRGLGHHVRHTPPPPHHTRHCTSPRYASSTPQATLHLAAYSSCSLCARYVHLPSSSSGTELKCRYRALGAATPTPSC